jgi:ribonuclease BN (tRNA processing enzyme)
VVPQRAFDRRPRRLRHVLTGHVLSLSGRRRFLAATAAFLAAPSLRGADRTRLILLGTAGGPRPKADRAATSQALLVSDRLYVVDCGDGVARQLVAAGARLDALDKVFITHHHSDHNADYGNLLLLAWASGLKTPVETYGPPPLERMTRLFFELNRFDIETRIEDEKRVPLEPLVHAKDLSASGLVVDDGRVRVRSVLVSHPPIEIAFGYRFDTEDRSVVFSGDTAYSKDLLELARGADVLVHEALYLPGIERTAARVANAPGLLEHIVRSHTKVEDAARLASEAGVKTLVLSHLVPSDDPLVTDQDWLAAAKGHFSGEIVVARDLLEI